MLFSFSFSSCFFFFCSSLFLVSIGSRFLVKSGEQICFGPVSGGGGTPLGPFFLLFLLRFCPCFFFLCVCFVVFSCFIVIFLVFVLFLSAALPGPPSPSPGPSSSLPRTAQNFALFSPLPPQFSFFLPSLGGLRVELWPRFNAEVCQSARLGSLGPFCETPAAFGGRRGSHKMGPEKPESALWADFGPQFHEKTPKRGKKE